MSFRACTGPGDPASPGPRGHPPLRHALRRGGQAQELESLERLQGSFDRGSVKEGGTSLWAWGVLDGKLVINPF